MPEDRSALPAALSLRSPYAWAPLTLSAALRAVYGILYWRTIPYARAPVVDAEIYVDLARELRAGQWLSPELIYHSFLYPFFLAAVPLRGDAFFAAVIAAQLALGVLATWLVMEVAWIAWRSPLTTALAGVGFALAIPIVFYETKLYSEALAVVLVAALLWQMARRSPAWIVGLTGGLLILDRPEAVFYAGIVALYAWKVDRPETRARRMAVALGAIAVCMGIAALRNSLATGVLIPTPSVTSGVAFYLGNNPTARGGYSEPPEFGSTVVGQSRQAKEAAERALGLPLDPNAVSRYWWGRGLAYLASDPVHAVVLAWQKIAIYAGVRENLLDLAFYSEREELPILRLLLLPFSALLLLGAAGFVGAQSSHDTGHARLVRQCSAAAILPSLIVCVLFFAQSRYRVTALVPALILAARGASRVSVRIRSPGSIARIGAAAAAAVAILLAQIEDDTPKDRAVAYYNLGIAHQRLGDDRAALAHFERAFTVAAPHPMVRSNYAASLARNGRPAEAEAVLRDGLTTDPQSPVLLVDVGQLEFNRGNMDEADRLFRAALESEPGNVAALLNRAIILRTRSRDPDALRQAAESFRALSASADVRYARHALLNLGLTYALLGQAALVDEPYQRAADIAPLSSGEEHDWAVALLKIGRTRDARAHAARAVELAPNDANAERLLRFIDQRAG